MRFSDVRVQHIYSVDFDPVHVCEFNRKHFAIVLKKNTDKKTVIVMPLTTSSKGEGGNKVNLGVIDTLPQALKVYSTYAVYNQMRTLNTDRFKPMLDGENNIIEFSVDDLVFSRLFDFGITDLTYNMKQDEKILLLKSLYNKECANKAINLAYNIIRLQKQIDKIQEEVSRIETEIQNILYNVPYEAELCQSDVDNGIDAILKDIIQKNS